MIKAKPICNILKAIRLESHPLAQGDCPAVSLSNQIDKVVSETKRNIQHKKR